MILAISRMKSKIVELEERSNTALKQREKLTALVCDLKKKVNDLEKKVAP